MDLHTDPAYSLIKLLKKMEQQGTDQDNPVRQRIFADMLNRQARSKAVPQQGIFELTPRCKRAAGKCMDIADG